MILFKSDDKGSDLHTGDVPKAELMVLGLISGCYFGRLGKQML